MLGTLKQWLGHKPSAASLHAVESWARAHDAVFRRVRNDEGFVIEGGPRNLRWRIEWGASHRPYVSGRELRIIAEMGLHRDLQALVLNRALMEHAESTVFQQYIDGVQTSIDTQIPTEIRWLVMYPKLTGVELSGLGPRFGAVASVKPWLLQWLGGALRPALQAASQTLREHDPFVLAIGRGRLTLRLAMPDPDLDAMGRWLQLFELAVREARRVAGEWQDSGFAQTSIRPSAWGPEEPRPGPSSA